MISFSEKLKALLKSREFISVATAAPDGQPNAVPKFLLKVEEPHIYLIDYTIGHTAKNLRANPRASLSLMDVENLEGYRLNGTAEILEDGEEYHRAASELQKKTLKLSADRVIDSIRTGKKHERFELELPDRFVALKIRVEDVVMIDTRGGLFREEVS